MIDVGHLPRAVRSAGESLLPTRERRRQVADDLYDALVSGGYSFWEHIHPIFLVAGHHEVRRPRADRQRSADDARELPGAAAALRDPAHGLQALPQLPDDARMQGGLPGVPSGHAGTRAHAARVAAAAAGGCAAGTGGGRSRRVRGRGRGSREGSRVLGFYGFQVLGFWVPGVLGSAVHDGAGRPVRPSPNVESCERSSP